MSTQNAASPKLLSVRRANHTGRGTGLSALQVAVSIDEKAVVHKKGLALLLLLFIYKTLKEQPKNILGAQNRCRGCQNRVGMARCLPPKWALEKRRPCSAARYGLRQPSAGSAGCKSGQRGWGGRSKPLFRPPGPPKRWHRRHAGPQSLWKGRGKARAAHPLAGRPPRPLVRPFKDLEQVVSRDCVG